MQRIVPKAYTKVGLRIVVGLFCIFYVSLHNAFAEVYHVANSNLEGCNDSWNGSIYRLIIHI
ncbi:MAG: hypothetical protein QXK37_00150 [Candidatus Woesearchaeota archaeon]